MLYSTNLESKIVLVLKKSFKTIECDYHFQLSYILNFYACNCKFILFIYHELPSLSRWQLADLFFHPCSTCMRQEKIQSWEFTVLQFKIFIGSKMASHLRTKSWKFSFPLLHHMLMDNFVGFISYCVISTASFYTK